MIYFTQLVFTLTGKLFLILLVKHQQVGWSKLTLSRNKPERGRGL